MPVDSQARGEARARLRAWAARPGVRRAALVGALLALAGARVAVVFLFTPPYNKMYSESLIRFRYAEMAMAGERPPAVDPMVQWPEGFPRDEMDMVGPDYLTGGAYRAWAALAGPVDDYVFLRYFMAAFSALYVAAAFALFAVVFRRRGAALAATALYALLLPTFWRAAGTYLREDFATPALLFATAATCFLISDRPLTRRSRVGVAAGLAVAVVAAMSSWHMASFYLDVLLAVVFLAAFAARPGRYGDVGLAFLAGAVVAAALNKPLWVKGVMWSPTTAAALALAAWGYWPGSKARPAARLALVGVAVVAAGAALAAAGGGAYGHAYALLWAKLRWLGVRPVDPALLAPDARIFWMGPYDTTTFRRALIEYGPLLPVALGALGWAIVRRTRRRAPASPLDSFIPLAMTAATGALYWLIVRLTIFAAPWLVAWATAPLAFARRRGARVAAAVALTGLLGYQIYWLYTLERPTPVRRLVELLPEPREPLWDYGAGDNDVFLWLGEHTKPGAAVLSQFGVSASILYWSHRPVALHPMFEVPEIRPKILAASGAYCGSEAALYELCRRWRISYVVFNAPAFLIYEPPGERYFAATPAPPADAAGMKMQFGPETLWYFRLVRETYAFRVFEVGRGYDGYRAPRYHPYFDPAVFGRLPSADEYYGEVAKIRRALDHYRLGLGYERDEKWTAAAAAYGRALGLHPDLEDAEQRLGYCLVRSGRLAEAGPHFRRAVATDPENALAHTYMGSFYLETGQYPAAVAEYRRAAALAPGDRDARARLAWVENINAGP